MTTRLLRILLVTLGILAVPLVAMQFTHEVHWTLLDFAVAATLLIATGLVFELAVRRIGNPRLRLAGAAALGLAFLLVWAQLAVGIV